MIKLGNYRLTEDKSQQMHANLFMSLKLTTYSYVRVQRKTEYSLLGLLWDITGANLRTNAVNRSGLSTILPTT